MDAVAQEIATRYLPQIEQLGTQPPELLDAALHVADPATGGRTEIIIILCDGRKLRFDTNIPPETAPRAPRKVPNHFAYIEEEIETIQAETKKKRKTK